MQGTISRKLAILAIEYGTPHTKAQLALQAVEWTRELARENPESIAAALDQHRRECSRFPTLADVLKLLPRCRVQPKRDALPEATPRDDWGDYPRTILAACRGDAAARAKMDALVKTAMGGRT